MALTEASTLKSRAQALLRDADTLLGDKALPAELTGPLKGLRAALKKKWADLADTGDAASAESAAPRLILARLFTEADAILYQDDSLDAVRDQLRQTLTKWGLAQAALEGEQPDWDDYPCICDLFPDAVVFRYDGDLWRADYTVNADDTITLGAPARVDIAYVPEEPGEPQGDDDDAAPMAMPMGEALTQKQRDALPSSAFGDPKGRKYPIVDQGTLDAASHLIGKASDPEAVKTRVITIAKRLKLTLPAAWQEQEAAAPLEGDYVPLSEAAAVSPDGAVKVKIIQPGWGTSGYYSPEVLQRDGPTAFPAGTHMFWDHQTAQEQEAQPEGSLRNLAGVQTTPAAWSDGPSGPGLYADARVFQPYADTLQEMAPHIGVSIRALGKGQQGEADGQQGRLITELADGISVDFVTAAGAGGEVLSLFEAARGRRPGSARPAVAEGEDMDPQALKEAQEQAAAALAEAQAAKAESAKLREAMVLRDAQACAARELARYPLHDLTRARLARELVPVAPLVEGALDSAAFIVTLKDAAGAALEELAAASGVGSGRPTGVGAPAEPPTAESAGAQLVQVGQDWWGLSEAEAKIFANPRG